jgi:hypothetical protein
MATQSNIGGSRSAVASGAWSSVLAAWRYRPASRRDLRLDLLRGFCIFVMVIDHIGGLSPFRAITGNNTFFVSAAEGFVFISGLLFGEIYRKVAERDGFGAATRKALQRAGKLYVLTFILTFGLAYLSAPTRWPWVSQEEMANPLRFAFNVLALRRSYFFTDILVMYTLLIAGSPVVLWLLRRGWTAAVIAGSWALWTAYQLAPELATQPLPTVTSFHPAAWQLFWVHAMVIGFHRDSVLPWLRALPRRLLVPALGLLSGALVAIYVTRGALIEPLIAGDSWAVLEEAFNKNPVRPGRVLAAAVVFPLAFLIVTHLWQPLRRAIGWLLLPLGQHSLYSYVMHLPLIVLAVWVYAWPAGVTPVEQLMNAGVQAVAILLLWVMIRTRFLFRIFPH